MKRVFSVAAFIALAGCAIPQHQEIEHRLSTPFDAEKARDAIQPGAGKVEGNAFMRQQGGGVVTCAGSDVTIAPVSEHAIERLSKLYGKAPDVGETVGRRAQDAAYYRIKFIPNHEEYTKISRQTRCDAQGEFVFSNLKDGRYFLVTTVAWKVQSLQGAILATQINVVNGKTDRVIMTQ